MQPEEPRASPRGVTIVEQRLASAFAFGRRLEARLSRLLPPGAPRCRYNCMGLSLVPPRLALDGGSAEAGAQRLAGAGRRAGGETGRPRGLPLPGRRLRDLLFLRRRRLGRRLRGFDRRHLFRRVAGAWAPLPRARGGGCGCRDQAAAAQTGRPPCLARLVRRRRRQRRWQPAPKDRLSALTGKVGHEVTGCEVQGRGGDWKSSESHDRSANGTAHCGRVELSRRHWRRAGEPPTGCCCFSASASSLLCRIFQAFLDSCGVVAAQMAMLHATKRVRLRPSVKLERDMLDTSLGPEVNVHRSICLFCCCQQVGRGFSSILGTFQ